MAGKGGLMTKKELDLLVEEINNECIHRINDYCTTTDYSNEYELLPSEENYDGVSYYEIGFINKKQEQKALLTLSNKYGYHSIEDMLHELYTNCEIETNIYGNIYYYRPHNTISFGVYPVEEVHMVLSAETSNKLKTLSISEYTYIAEEIEEYLLSKETILINPNIQIAFELSIEDAIDYLENKE